MLHDNEIGKRIILFRKEKGYTQEQLSSLLYITPQAVSKWEKGSALPDTALLPLLARVLEVTIDKLLTGDDSLKKPGPYDKEYEKEQYYWGLEHSLLAEQIVKLMPEENQQGKRLLDIGSGEGRDSIYFAKWGFEVDSLEISTFGAEKMKQYSDVSGCTVNVLNANMIGYDITTHYDVIYSMGSLQFLPPNQRQKHFDKYKLHTCFGGLNAHLVFVEKPFIKTAPDWNKNEFYYLSGELAGYYWDWEIVQCGERIIECNSTNIPHQHAVNYIIARKV